MKTILKEIGIIGLGVQKTASSWLEVQLNAHPEVFMSNENFLFSLYGRNKGQKYVEHIFRNYKGEKHIGNYHNEYLYSDYSINFLSKHYQKAKYYVILRDPIKRAISNFNHCKRFNQIPLGFSFEESLNIGGISYQLLYRGYYDIFLKRLFQKIPSNNIKVLIYEDMLNDPVNYLTGLLSFLNLEHIVDTNKIKSRENVTYLPKSRFLFKLTRKLKQQQKYQLLASNPMQHIYSTVWKMNEKKIPPTSISETTINCLINQYSDTKCYVEELLKRDLSGLWLNINSTK